MSVRALTCAQVRLSRPIGAVLRAEMMEVNVEKLFIARHFCTGQYDVKENSTSLTYIGNGDEVLDDYDALLDV